VTRLALVSAAALISLSACAPTATDNNQLASSRESRQCFNVDQVNNFTGVDRQTALFHTNQNRVFKVETVGICASLDSSLSVGIQADAPGLDRVCVGDFARLSLADATPTRAPCRARVTQQLTTEEVAALTK
jgi:hypothetical protein